MLVKKKMYKFRVISMITYFVLILYAQTEKMSTVKEIFYARKSKIPV